MLRNVPPLPALWSSGGAAGGAGRCGSGEHAGNAVGCASVLHALVSRPHTPRFLAPLRLTALRLRRCDLCRAYQPELERVAAAFEGLQGDQARPLLFARCVSGSGRS